MLFPSSLPSLVTAFTSKSLFGEILGSPVINIYFAGKKSLLPVILGFIVRASTCCVGGVLKKDFAFCPYRVIPISSNAREIGINPPSMY